MTASGGRAAVASGHERVTGAACDILRAGGNAFDAVIAAGFASAAAEPALTSLGGGGFLLARPSQGPAALFDFFVDTPGRGLPAGELEPHLVPVRVEFPGSSQVFHAGLGSAAVPGNLRGFLQVHARLGCMPLADVLSPALVLAREGVTLNEHQAYFLDLLRPIKTLTEQGRALYEPAGRYVSLGDRLPNPELAAFLDTLPRDGDRELYEGEIARGIARDMRDGAGLLTQADLAAYRVIEREPLRIVYRGYELLTNPPPSFGGSLLGLSLRLFEAAGDAPARFGDASHLARLTAVMREADRLRESEIGGGVAPEHWEETLARLRRASGGTTHVSVCDADGNTASLTTSNGEGSGYFAPGSGVMLNNMMGEDDLHPEGFHASPPGLRVASMMAPSLLLHDAQPHLVLGSGGSKRIRTALLQAVCNAVDFGMDVRALVDAPRLHWDGECLQAEPGFGEEEIAPLRTQVSVNVWDVRDVYFGGVNAVSPGVGDRVGNPARTSAAGDPRRGGHAAVLD